MSRIIRFLAIFVVLGAGTAAAISGVLAFEAQVVQVSTSVSNAITVDTNLLEMNESFPQEFRRNKILVDLSSSFDNTARVASLDVGIWVECQPGAHWMGDFAYLAKSDPGFQLPGGKDVVDATGVDEVSQSLAAGGDPPRTSAEQEVNAPWVYVGGDPILFDTCPGANVIGVFTNSDNGPISLAKSAPATELHIGLDIPVCVENFQTSTDSDPSSSGWDEPSVLIHPVNFPNESDPADPRHPSITGTSLGDCAYDVGMNIVFQVLDIFEASETPGVFVSPTELTLAALETKTFTVSLSTVPSGTVEVFLITTDAFQGIPKYGGIAAVSRTLIFDPSVATGVGNTDSVEPKVVEVIAQPQFDGSPFAINITPISVSADPDYLGIDPPNVIINPP